MTIAYDDTSGAVSGGVTTSNATVTDVPGLRLAIADKTTTILEVDFIAVRKTTTPLVYFTRRIYTCTLVAGAASIAGSTMILEHGDPTLEGAIVVDGGANVKAQVTGLAAHHLRVARRRQGQDAHERVTAHPWPASFRGRGVHSARNVVARRYRLGTESSPLRCAEKRP